jgi:hypothetical protein
LSLTGAAADLPAHAPPPIHHDIAVSVSPRDHRLEAEDVVSFPAGRPEHGSVYFRLHAGLEVESADSDYAVEALTQGRGEASTTEGPGAASSASPLREYRLRPVNGSWPSDPKPRLRFQGKIYHPPVAEPEEYVRSFSRTPGIISEDGVALWGGSYWLPAFGEDLMSFRLTVTIPEGWDVVSQGRRTLHEVDGPSRRVQWESPEPTDEVYLVAGRFSEYSRRFNDVTAYAFLRQPDPSLAAKYLEATGQYIEMYRKLIGPYPYAKFALVENFWDTGYGMPSFTLLGPKVIQLPFILHSSFPHEILHNWWGNSVFVDYEGGNWSEGLTAYLADHLVREGQGRGAEMRRDSLERYSAYVREERDFPLEAFGSRHSFASEAIGYGKSMMLWHMLRLRLGDEQFVEGLQLFYRRHRFRRASFDDLSRAFSEVAGEDLEPFFRQWVKRTGAPELSFESRGLGTRRIALTIRQEQAGELYELTVPVAVTLAGESEARVFSLDVAEREAEFELNLSAPAIRIDLDPYFDVFRRLDARETPPTLRDVVGAERVTLVLPEADAGALGPAWEEFARTWSTASSDALEVVKEQEIAALPGDRGVWVFGNRNRWRDALLPALESHGARVDEREIHIGDQSLPVRGHSFVFVSRHPRRPDLALAWVGVDSAAALAGLTRKLPHYERYSYLVFSGDELTNVAKGQWPALDSPLVRSFAPDGDEAAAAPGALRTHPRAALPSRQPLGRLPPAFDRARLMSHVELLAGDSLEGRGIGTSGLREAGEYIARAFESAGLEPGGDDGGFFQTWTEPEGPGDEPVTLRNVVGVLPGTDRERRLQSVVVGAHYDHLGRGWPDVRAGDEGVIHSGADDNASGVAVLLELAALLGEELEPARSIVFVAFSGEEWDRKGSIHYLEAMQRWPAEQILAMVNLDGVGRLEGREISVLGAGTADEWLHIVMGVGFTTGIGAKSIVNDPGGSDQASFHAAGVPAVQIFSGTHADYHRPSDAAGKIDAEGLVKVATFVREILVYLSDRDRRLTSKLATTAEGAPPATPAGRRRVMLGTVPDFAFPGPGVRVASVVAGSPAEAAALREGDIVVAIEGEAIADLKAFADALRERQAGDILHLVIRRGAAELNVEAQLEAR